MSEARPGIQIVYLKMHEKQSGTATLTLVPSHFLTITEKKNIPTMASSEESDHSGRTKGVVQHDNEPKSPLIAIHAARKEIKKGQGRSIVELKQQIRQFYFTASGYGCVDKKHSERDLGCKCLIIIRSDLLDEDLDDMTDSLFEYAMSERMEQMRLVREWMRFAMMIKVF